MRAQGSYSLPSARVNPRPFSCTLKETLGETLDGGVSFDSTRSGLLGISLDLSGSIPVIRVSHPSNTQLAKNWAQMMYEARLQYTPVGSTSLVDSTSRSTLLFKFFLFPDCGPRETVTELVDPPEAVDGEFQIDGTPTSLLSLDLTLPRFIAELNEAVCPLTPALVHNA